MYTKFKKSLGQNFLKDEYYIQKTIDCVHFSKISNFLEIGPGDGQLTEKIIQLKEYMDTQLAAKILLDE